MTDLVDLIDNVIGKEGDAMRWAPDREPLAIPVEAGATYVIQMRVAFESLTPALHATQRAFHSLGAAVAALAAVGALHDRRSRMHAAYRQRRR